MLFGGLAQCPLRRESPNFGFLEQKKLKYIDALYGENRQTLDICQNLF